MRRREIGEWTTTKTTPHKCDNKMSNHGASIEDLSGITLLNQPFANGSQAGGSQSLGESHRRKELNTLGDDGHIGDEKLQRSNSSDYFQDDVTEANTPHVTTRASKDVNSDDLRALSGATNVLAHRVRERISEWKSVALTQLKIQMDEQAIKVAELKEEYVHSRKTLVAELKAYTNRSLFCASLHVHVSFIYVLIFISRMITTRCCNALPYLPFSMLWAAI